MEQTSQRQLAGVLAAAFGAAVLTGAILTGGDRFGSLLVVAVVVAAAVTALVRHLQRLDRAIQGGLGRHQAEQRERLRQLDERTGQQLAALTEAVNRLPAGVAEASAQAAAAANRELQSRLPRLVYAKVEAHADLHGLVRPRAPMPPLDFWALDPDILHLIASLLWERKPELIVECGSGSSSVWLGYLAEQLGAGRVVALEHDLRFRRASQDLVRAHGLRDTVEIRHAPLSRWSDQAGATYQWYDRAALADLTEIDLLLVDGPPGTTGGQARYPAGPLLLPRCSAAALIVLDDTDRPDEQAISDRWLAEWPRLERTEHRHGRAHVFARPGGTDA
jgi:predicted O-methyltransferase YrrM